MTQMGSILRKATKKEGKPLNILTFVSHERFEPNLCLTGHNFYSIGETGDNQVRRWNTEYSPIPDNYQIIGIKPPADVDFDVIITQNPFVHIPLAYELNKSLGLPIINIFHTTPTPQWSQELRNRHNDLFNLCNHHVFISEFNKILWKDFDEGSVIKHGIDTNIFSASNLERKHHVLTVANDYIGRNWALGFDFYRDTVLKHNLPRNPVGRTKGFSLPSKSLDDVIHEFQTSQVFYNTTIHSPLPMSLLEAMSCGCAVVSTSTCMIPDVIEHGVDGFLVSPNNPEKAVKYLQTLLNDKDMAAEFGKKAREKMMSMFSIEEFVKQWNDRLWSECND